MRPDILKEAEAKSFQKFIVSSDLVVLLDEKGRQYDSRGFANQIQNGETRALKGLCSL